MVRVLERAKAVGFLGPGPVEDHIAHAESFARALLSSSLPVGSGESGLRFADLGAGGGVPSLPMLCRHPGWSAVLIDAAQKRCSFLTWAAVELDLVDRVEVRCGRAEELAHESWARFQFETVVARGFGPPAFTVECGVALLADGGHLLISEPPSQRRWPADALDSVGLEQLDGPGDAGAEPVAVFRRSGTTPPNVPRRIKAMRARPLFEGTSR